MAIFLSRHTQSHVLNIVGLNKNSYLGHGCDTGTLHNFNMKMLFINKYNNASIIVSIKRASRWGGEGVDIIKLLIPGLTIVYVTGKVYNCISDQVVRIIAKVALEL